MRRLIVCLIVALALVSCASTRQGVIVKKNFTPAHTTTRYQDCGKNCTMPVQEFHGDRWEFLLRECKAPDDCIESWVDVTAADFERGRAGDRYSVDSGFGEPR